MMCMDVHCEDGDEDVIVYRDSGVSTEEHDKAMYGKLMKTQSEEEEEIKYNVALCVEKPLFMIGLISFCADQFSSCALF